MLFRSTGAAVSSSTAGDISTAMSGLFPSSEYDVFSAALDYVVAPVLVSARPPRETRTTKRPADLPRVRKKSAVEDKRPAAFEDKRPVAVEADAKPRVKKEHIMEEKLIAAAVEAESVGTDDVSMDSAWHSIVRSGAARPVAVRKSETWGRSEERREGKECLL